MSAAILKAGPLAAALALFLFAGAAKAADEIMPPDVRVEATDEIGQVLADGKGMTLYTWDGDRKAGESLCDDTRIDKAVGGASKHYFVSDAATRPTCQQLWPPFVASAGAKPTGAFTLLTRKDGTRQWARDGKPLYTFAFDTRPGEINGTGGQGFRRVARVSPPAPVGIVTGATAAGLVFMTDKGKALYVEAGRPLKASTASQEAHGWQPLAAPAVAGNPPKGWAIAESAGGARQWRYQGKAVYTYADDLPFGELQGMGQKGWAPLVLQSPVAHPPEITVHWTGEGPAFADKDGKTAYVWSCAEETVDRGLCDVPGTTQSYRRSMCGPPETCLKLWKPVEAPADAKPIGRTWSIVNLDPTGVNQFAALGQPGLRVWAYRGRPLYTYARDKEPGDQKGQIISAGLFWGFQVLRADGRLGPFG